MVLIAAACLLGLISNMSTILSNNSTSDPWLGMGIVKVLTVLLLLSILLIDPVL